MKLLIVLVVLSLLVHTQGGNVSFVSIGDWGGVALADYHKTVCSLVVAVLTVFRAAPLYFGAALTIPSLGLNPLTHRYLFVCTTPGVYVSCLAG